MTVQHKKYRLNFRRLCDRIKAVGKDDVVDGMIGQKLDGLRSLCSYVLHGSELLSGSVPLIHCRHDPRQTSVAETVGDNQKLWTVGQLDHLRITCTLRVYVLPLST